MAITVPVSVSVGSGESAVVKTVQQSGADYQRIEADITVGVGATDLRAGLAIDVSHLKSIMLLADQNLTIETNSGSSPAQTITLTANIPFFWQVGSGITNPLTTDVTDLYITNGSGVATTLYVRGVQDCTP